MKIPPNVQPYVFRALEKVLPFRRTPEKERRLSIRKCALFHGDLPKRRRSPAIGTIVALENGSAGDGAGPENFVCSEDYRRPRPLKEAVKGITYTPEGFAWHRGTLEERFSVREVRRLAPLLSRPRPGLRLPTGTIIQCESPNTYGDWVSEQIKCIAMAGEFPQPLVLPRFLGARPYVGGELTRLGIAFVVADKAVHIEDACVLRKQTPRTFWYQDEVAAYRSLFGLEPEAPAPGSLLYLSRQGVRSEQVRAARDYRSEVIAEAVRELGGTVAETAAMSFDDYAALSGVAETVIADHGAAMFNLMQWHSRNVVEIVTDTWWSPCFVFLSRACGARHTVLRSGIGSDADLKARIGEVVSHLRRPNPAP